MVAFPFLIAVATAVAALQIPRANALDGQIVPGRYIITLKEDADSPTIDSHIQWVSDVQAQSLSKREEKGVNKVWKNSFKGYSGEFDDETLEEIRQSGDVVAVEPVTVMSPARSVPRESGEIILQKNATWGLGSLSHRTPNSTEYVYHESAGEGTWAYVVDTGIYIEHEEFEGRARLGYNALPEMEFKDSDGHGTHVAGTIASKTYGVAKKANLVAVKVFGDEGSTNEIVIDGFEWAVNDILAVEGRRGKSVINMSLGGPKSEALNLAVRKAYVDGVLSVVAAGNQGIRADLWSPASEITAITVAASTETNERALFSNWGSKVDLFAAGTNVLSTYIGSPDATYSQSGTSMAAPHVAGLVLYLKAAEPQLEGAAAVTDRIIELTTKEILEGVPQETFNRLAFNGVKRYGTPAY